MIFALAKVATAAIVVTVIYVAKKAREKIDK